MGWSPGKQVDGRERWYAKVYLRTKNDTLLKDKKTPTRHTRAFKDASGYDVVRMDQAGGRDPCRRRPPRRPRRD